MTGATDSLLRNDSLRRAAEQLFLQGAHFRPAGAADTLQTVVPPATAADLFGTGSALAATPAATSVALPLTDNPLFQCLVLALAAIYALLIYYHPAEVYALFSRSASNAQGAADLRNRSGYSHFLNLTGMTGLLLTGVLCVKCIALSTPAQTLPYQAAAGVSLIVTSALLLVVAVQAGMLFLIGAVTLTQEFIGEIIHIRRTTLALATISIAPALLFYALAPPGSGQWWAYILAAEGLIITLFFLRKTLILFLSKKISILHWILYLCIVETFPVSLLWLLIARQ